MSKEETLNNLLSIKDKKERNKKIKAYSTLASVAMLSKLLKRKQKGKKPFSEEFDFDRRIKEIDEFLNQDSEIFIKDLEKVSKQLNNIYESANLATDQIKMNSLKNDFIWIAKQIKHAI